MSSYLVNEWILIPSVYCFLFLYLIRFVVVIRREDWFLIWVGLEINIISFLILIYKRYRIIIGESCLKYFFIQRLRSSLFVRFFYINRFEIGGIIPLILSLKIGAGPFFFWFPSLCLGLDWISCYILILFQKILPLVLIFIFIHWVLWFIIRIRLIIGVLGSFDQRNIKYLIAYSSIHHLGWILIVGMIKNVRWILYLVIYGLVLYSVVILLLKDNVINLIYLYTSKCKMVFVIILLSIGGVPPLLGFYLKWIALINIIDVRIIYLFILIVVSVVMLYIYIRIGYDVFIGGGINLSLSWGYYKYMERIEVLRVAGLVFGIFFLLFFI